MRLQDAIRDIFFPPPQERQEETIAPLHQATGDISEESKEAAPTPAKKIRRTPHPVRNAFAWILGSALLAIAAFLFLKAFIPALILITIAVVVHPAGKEFLFRFFGFDLCYRCRTWVVILGSLLFLASLGWMNQKNAEPEPPAQHAAPFEN